jgi:hypothetical protein
LLRGAIVSTQTSVAFVTPKHHTTAGSFAARTKSVNPSGIVIVQITILQLLIARAVTDLSSSHSNPFGLAIGGTYRRNHSDFCCRGRRMRCHIRSNGGSARCARPETQTFFEITIGNGVAVCELAFHIHVDYDLFCVFVFCVKIIYHRYQFHHRTRNQQQSRRRLYQWHQ